MSRARMLPLARPAAEFLVEDVGDEVLVYDQVMHRAHCLTPAAALVWRLCDGRSDEVAAQAALADHGAAQTLPEVLAQLSGAGLVRQARPRRRSVDRSRRALLGKTALVAGAVLASPVVFSIVAPSVAEAASTVGCGKKTQPCCATPPPCEIGQGKCLSGFCS